MYPVCICWFLRCGQKDANRPFMATYMMYDLLINNLLLSAPCALWNRYDKFTLKKAISAKVNHRFKNKKIQSHVCASLSRSILSSGVFNHTSGVQVQGSEGSM